MIAALLFAACAAANPDAKTAPDFRGFEAVFLVNDPTLAPHLDLSQDQKERAEQELKTYLNLRVERANVVRTKKQEATRDELAKLDADSAHVSERCATILSEEQRKRLEEIAWQALGVDAFFIPRHREALGMTREEFDKVAPRIEEFTADFKKRHKEFGQTRTEEDYARFKKDAAVLEAAATKEIVPMLREETQIEYARRCGEPAGISKWDLKTHWPVSK